MPATSRKQVKWARRQLSLMDAGKPTSSTMTRKQLEKLANTATGSLPERAESKYWLIRMLLQRRQTWPVWWQVELYQC